MSNLGLVKKRNNHGMSKTKIYGVWAQILQRCYNPSVSNYHNYGGRGISVCKKWLEFDGFIEDMGLNENGLTLERINVDGDYCKENCTWVTHREQQINRSNNIESIGVYYYEKQKLYLSTLTYKGKRYYKYFKTKDDAIKYRKYLEKKYII